MPADFGTEITKGPEEIAGPWRSPKQMLADQEYGGHLSIHDDDTAEKLGFAAGPIEGPTHFSQFDPLLVSLWGDDWFKYGCISSHYKNTCVEGDEVRAHVAIPADGAKITRIFAEKKDGTPVLEGSASLGPDHPETELDARRAKLRPPEKLLILEDLQVGMKGDATEPIKMDFDQHMGKLYPFSLEQKLTKITEKCAYYDPKTAGSSPWGRAVIPFEMLSVLAEYSARTAKWPVKGPAVGLFADLEIRLIDGPIFVGEQYKIDREVIAISESRRTESYWVRSTISDNGGTVKAEVVLNHATLKDSYAGYQNA